MKICYIPPVKNEDNNKYLPVFMASAMVASKNNLLENAISEALTKVIVEPCKKWALHAWFGFMDFSHAVCFSIALAGVICGMLGIKKGYKASVLSIVFYFMLSLISWAKGWR